MNAQPTTVSFRVFTDPAGARFAVDGIIYTSAANFQWPAGSKHYVRFVQDAQLNPSAFVFTDPSTPTLAPVQVTADGASVYAFSGFTDAHGLLVPGSDPNQVVTADPAVPSLMIGVSLTYRVLLNFFDNPPATSPPSCGAPGSISNKEFRVGLVYIGSQCFWNNAILYFPANSTLQLNAFPFPGFVFSGWSSNLGSSNAYLTNYVLKGPVTIAPRFEPAKRVRFETSPIGLQALVDRTPTPTLSSLDPSTPCPHNEGLPVTVPSTVAALCRGDFDFAPGSAHLVGALTPQYDRTGNLWVFDSWGSGQGQNAIYTADFNTASADTVLIKFVPGVQASFVTSPTGLKLNIDGRSNWPAYNFVWGSGTSHQVSALAEQFDSQGRKFTFRNWSNGGGVTQSFTVDSTSATSLRMIANYDGLARVAVQTSPPGLKVQIEGADCQTPCSFDRANGTQLRISAPASIAASPDTRLDFSNWSDGGASDHLYTLGSDSQILTASYNTSYRLTAASDPANAITYTFDPVAPDMFYPAATQINVTAEAKPGFKFRRWAGDLSGTYASGTLTMYGPHSVLALADRIPYIAPAGVHNLAGDTPDGTVAPGSLIAITGESLAPNEETGRVNPLAQTIGGVTVTLADRLLPLVSVSPQQVTAQLPSDLSGGDYTLQIHSAGQPDVSGNFTVARNSPGLLVTLSGGIQYCTCMHGDGTPVTSDSPAKRGETVMLLGTGFGPYASPMVDGFFPPDPASALSDSVQLSIGAATGIPPSWAGAASGYTGLTATRFKITDDLPGSTTLPITVTVNGKISNTVMLPIE
ncbi:MAG: InlB B-repeat-containing protein [Bryobacteraceae bacterium]